LKRIPCITLIVTILAIGSATGPAAYGQTFLGIGIGGSLPSTGLADGADYGLNGEIRYGLHRYCNVWPVAAISFDTYPENDTATAIAQTYPTAVSAMASLRWFPWGSTSTPLYASIGTGLAVNLGNDSELPVGLPGQLGIGYLFLYENPCCDWFLDVQLRYTAYNMLRDLDRPHLSALTLMIAVGIPLGGAQ